MMLCRERASVEEGRVEGRMVDEGYERGRYGTRHGRREGKRGGRKRAEDILREEGSKIGSKGGSETSTEVVYSQTNHSQTTLALGTLGGREGGREGEMTVIHNGRNFTLFVHRMYTCNKADDNSDTATSLSFPPQYLNYNHVTYCVIT